MEKGYNTLVGADKDKILAAAKDLANKKLDFTMDLYGDGHAGDKVVKMIMETK